MSRRTLLAGLIAGPAVAMLPAVDVPCAVEDGGFEPLWTGSYQPSSRWPVQVSPPDRLADVDGMLDALEPPPWDRMRALSTTQVWPIRIRIRDNYEHAGSTNMGLGLVTLRPAAERRMRDALAHELGHVIDGCCLHSTPDGYSVSVWHERLLDEIGVQRAWRSHDRPWAQRPVEWYAEQAGLRLGGGGIAAGWGFPEWDDDVFDALWLGGNPPEEEAKVTVERVAGADRYATSAAWARRYDPADVDTVILASGRDFPDALSAAPAGLPVMLVDPDRLPAPIRDALARLRPSAILVAGGPAAVSERVVDEARAAADGG